ncbi:MAG TPA: SdpI family protein [Anaerolineales bacterium]|nr:SdpI family protein [Anaerolineales bacterium]
MSTKLTAILAFILIVVAAIAGALLWNRLPDPMPAHWNAAGEIDGYMTKFWGVFLLPIISLALTGLFLIIPNIDPLKANIAQFRATFNWFIVVFAVYMLYVYTLTLFAALGTSFNMTLMLLPAVGLLFIGIGYLMNGAKRNFFIGIRTPWTLSNDTVWDKTHKLGSKLFMLGGVVAILCAFLGETGIWVMLVAILFAAFVPVVYSYALYQRETKS